MATDYEHLIAILNADTQGDTGQTVMALGDFINSL